VTDEIHVLTYNIHKGYCTGNRRFVLESMRQRIAETEADVVFLHTGGQPGMFAYADALT